jgi:hypothetical protein
VAALGATDTASHDRPHHCLPTQVKCRLQAQLGAPPPAAGAPALFTGPMDVISRTVRAEGLAGLWRGNLSTLAREVPAR